MPPSTAYLRIVANNSGVVSSYLPNIPDLISYGHITVGVFHPTGCIAIATDGEHTFAMLRRRCPDETMAQLLARLDQALNKAVIEHIYTDKSTRPPDIPKPPSVHFLFRRHLNNTTL